MLRTRRLAVGSLPALSDYVHPRLGNVRAGGLIYQTPPGTRAILRELIFYWEGTSSQGWVAASIVPSGGLEAVICSGAMGTAASNWLFTYTGDTVLEPLDELICWTDLGPLSYYASGAELPILG